MMKDDWVAAALEDDAVVAEMLFRLKQSHSSQTSDACAPANRESLCLLLPPLHWGSRQPRSKSSGHKWSRCGGSAAAVARSPTTPLSWSGGSASPSDGGGCDESSLPPSSSSDLSSAFRSKCAVTAEIFNISSCSSQGSKRKKTFDVLKEEENSLLKERVDLERELASAHANLGRERAHSENLKRIRVDPNPRSSEINTDGRNQEQETVASCQYKNRNLIESTKTHHVHPTQTKTTIDVKWVSSDSVTEVSVSQQKKRGFVLPDLNMEPSSEEEDDYEEIK
ncbi:hypothetical protein DM860_007576 [Cuscuta australis]|uniref:Uncharacterized protein n=1 Tax=Cuscuta australis TaxID=267555 RepID=A0A328E838_9ASTE|nr:hypothetical protein DM860_007576 [Cuscuta australis]